MENPNPVVFDVTCTTSFEEYIYDPQISITQENIFSIIRRFFLLLILRPCSKD